MGRRSLTPAENMLAVCLGTFHTIGIVLPLIIGLYLGGSLPDLFDSGGGSGTLIGIGAFLVLYVPTVFFTRSAFQRSDVMRTGAFNSKVFSEGTDAGGRNGVAFLLIVFGALSAYSAGEFLAEGHTTRILALVFFDAIVAVIGGAIAYGVGSIVGFLLAIVDSTILTMAGLDERRPPLPPPEPQP